MNALLKRSILLGTALTLALIFSQTAAAGTTTVQVDIAVTSLENSADPVIAGAGNPTGNSDFTFTLTNIGTTGASTVVATFVASTTGGIWTGPGCTRTPSQGTFTWPTWSVGSIAAAATATISEVCVTGSASEDGANRSLTLSLTSLDQADSNSTNDSSTLDATISREVDIVMGKTESDDPVTAGSGTGNLVYTVTATNNGPSDVTGATFTEVLTLPAGVSVDSVVPSTGAVGGSSPSFTWTGVDLSAAGGFATLTVTLTVDSSTAVGTDSISDTATLTGSTGGETFINTGNDAVTVSTSVIRSSDLVLTSKTDAPDPVIAGTNLTYTITVDNDGPSDADNVTVVDVLPTGLTYVSDTDSCVESPTGTLTCNVGTMVAGADTSFDIVAAVDVTLAHNTVLSNNATVSSDSPDPNGGNNTLAAAIETTVITEAYWDVSKSWTDDTTLPVNITLTCNDVVIETGVATPGAGATTLTVTGFDNGNTSCTVTEAVPDRTFEEYSVDCSVADVVSATTYTCDIINAPSLATFEVRKRFMDGNDSTQVTFNIQCNDGLPLDSSLTVFPDQGDFVRGEVEVTFVVELFAPGHMDCTVWEEDVPNYTASYVCGAIGDNPTVCTDGDASPLDNFSVGPCGFENVDSAVADTSRNFCTIRNYPDPATFTVNKDWVVIGPGGNLIEQEASITIWCDTEFSGSTPSGRNWRRTFTQTGDFSPFVTLVPEYPSSTCWAEESIISDAVETENNCDGDELVAGGSASCDIINTVFFEGIPTLNQYGLALLALLMLGIGAVGLRRFV